MKLRKFLALFMSVLFMVSLTMSVATATDVPNSPPDLTPQPILGADAPHALQRIPLGITRSTSRPTTFWNIAVKGVYGGTFTGVPSKIYTNYFFDTGGKSKYTIRVDVANDWPDGTTFRVKNYCYTCGSTLFPKLLGETGDISTDGSGTGYLYYNMPVSGHEDHFVYPGVQCTGPYSISGTIDVNYADTPW